MAGLVPPIRVFIFSNAQDVDARDEPGHDESTIYNTRFYSAGLACAASVARAAAARRSTKRTDRIDPS